MVKNSTRRAWIFCAVVALSSCAGTSHDPRLEARPAGQRGIEGLTRTNQRVSAMLDRAELQLEKHATRKRGAALAKEALAQIDRPGRRPDALLGKALHQTGRGAYYGGDPDRALALFRRATVVREKALGPKHPDLAASLNALGVLHSDKGDNDKALLVYERSLSICERAYGPEHPDVARSLNNLAALHETNGAYDTALSLYERSLNIFQKNFGSDHHIVAALLSNVADLSQRNGDYDKAQQLYRRALAIFEKTLEPNHPNISVLLNNMAVLRRARGDHNGALSLYKRSLTIREQALGPGHPASADSLNNLANVYTDMGDHGKAQALFKRSLAIYERSLGPNHPKVAVVLGNLARRYHGERDYERAMLLCKRSLAIKEQALGLDHPDVAHSLNNLAMVHAGKGDHQSGLALFKRSLAIYERALGRNHPDVAGSLSNLTEALWTQGKHSQAAPLALRAASIRSRHLRDNLHSSTPRQRRTFIRKYRTDLHRLITLALRTGDPALRVGVADLALERKGLELSASASSLRTLRQHLDDEGRRLLAELQTARGRMAALAARSLPGDERKAASLRRLQRQARKQVERLEEKLAGKSALFAKRLERPSATKVAAKLASDEALVEWLVYEPYDPKKDKYGKPRLAAIVLRRRQPPVLSDLGLLERVERQVVALRQAIIGRRAGVKTPAAALHASVLTPLMPELKASSTWILSPDGPLHLAPFAALVDSRGRWLLESRRLRYVTSGRDLLTDLPAPHKQGPLLVADADFGARAAKAPRTLPNAAGPAERAPDAVTERLGQLRFSPLPGTRREADTLGKLLGLDADRKLLGARANEAALLAARGPRVLHIATHGFFLPRPEAKSANEHIEAALDDPMLRSGLALAGFNRRGKGNQGDDGMLTAVEAAGLDLYGTEMVVLSACETGVGKAASGEGLYGLKRALIMAGARSQAATLWKVGDDATQALMSAWYHRLNLGEDRLDALREVQLAMAHAQLKPGGASVGSRGAKPLGQASTMRSPRRSTDWTHPWYWAGITLSGADGKVTW